MSLADYAGRSYDFLALQNVKARGDSRLGLELAKQGDSTYICVGIQKLTQRWLLEFLTELGSMPGLPARGTDFMTRVRQGRIRTEAALRAAFAFAEYDARINLQKEEEITWPDDERLAGVDLLAVAFLPGYANLRVGITSRAGAARDIILPVATLP